MAPPVNHDPELFSPNLSNPPMLVQNQTWWGGGASHVLAFPPREIGHEPFGVSAERAARERKGDELQAVPVAVGGAHHSEPALQVMQYHLQQSDT